VECILNITGNTNTEMGKLISAATLTLLKLHLLWRHSSCPIRFKLLVADAVLRSKVLYGRESAQLGELAIILEIFQLETG